LTVNLAVAMARLGHQVGIVDADFSLGNVDVRLGLTPDDHIGDVLSGVRTVRDVTLDGPSHVQVIPAGSGVRALTTISDTQWTRLVGAITDAASRLDFLLFDTATGISAQVLDVIGLADYALVVTANDPAAVVDAYAVIKLICAADATKPIGLVVNSVRDADEAALVHRQIALAAERFLGRTLRNDGYVLEDRAVRDAGLAQAPVVGVDGAGPAAVCIRRLATRLVAARPSGAGPWPSRPVTVGGADMEAFRCA
jgi:flagellar biosynthesis protein FlhG